MGTGDQSFILTILQLLFGQTGALGTVLIGMCGFLAWLLIQERKSHDETRGRMQEMADKRTEIFESYIKVVADLKTSVDLLSARGSGNVGNR